MSALDGTRSASRHWYAVKRETQNQLCWAYVSLADLLVKENSFDAAETALRKGLDRANVVLDRDPTSVPFRIVAATIHHRIAAVYCSTGKADQAPHYFEQAISEMESLCSIFPLNAQHWTALGVFQNDAFQKLQFAGRNGDAKNITAKAADWGQEMAPRIAGQPKAQSELLRFATQLHNLLVSTGQEDKADELARTFVSLSEISGEHANKPAKIDDSKIPSPPTTNN